VGGPKVVWRAPVANGYAGPAVVGERVFVMDFITDADVKISNFDRRPTPGTERVLCLDAATGKQLWKVEYPAAYAISYPSGPRCTPVVEDGFVYTLGAEGHLACMTTDKGDVVWERELKSDYNTPSALWGYAGHPFLDGDKLICTVGGEGSHTVAFNKATGKEIWRSGTAPEQGYVSPRIIEAGGVRQLILCSPAFVRSVNPESGDEYWSEEYGASNGSVIMTPIQIGKYLYVGGYSQRSLLLELDPKKPAAKKLFRDDPELGISPVNVQPVVEDGLIVGIDQSGELMAVELPTGKRLWKTSQPLGKRPVGNGTAFLVGNGDKYFLFTEAGELVIAQLSRAGYKEIDRAKVVEPTNNAFGRPVAWCMPAFANGRMFVRTNEECVCIELTQSK
jgi:outer membrane protein assembly factor BamB